MSEDRAMPASQAQATSPEGPQPPSASSRSGVPIAGPTPGPWEAKAIQPYELQGDTVVVDYDAKPHCWAIWHRNRDGQGRRVSRPVADVHVVGQEWGAAE